MLVLSQPPQDNPPTARSQVTFWATWGGSLCALAEGVLADLQIESGVSAKREDRTDRRELLTDGEPWVSPRKGKTRQ